MSSDVPSAGASAPTQLLLRLSDVDLDADVHRFLERSGRGAESAVTALPLWMVRAASDWRAWAMDEKAPLYAVRDVAVPRDASSVDGRAAPLALRIYEPSEAPQAPVAADVILYAHGGGFVLCSIATHDGLCRRLAAATGLRIVSVGYRMPPEDAAPAMHRDVCAAYAYAQTLACAGGGVVVAGDSAGGNLVTSLCIALASAAQGGADTPFGPAAALAALPRPRAQLLLYPSVDWTSTRPSLSRYASGWLLSSSMRAFFSAHMFGDPAVATTAERRANFFFSPALAPPALLAAQPPTVLVTAEHDMLHDDGVAYAAALTAAGSAGVEHVEARGLFHGFANTDLPRARAAVLDAAARLTSLLQQLGGGASGGGGSK